MLPYKIIQDPKKILEELAQKNCRLNLPENICSLSPNPLLGGQILSELANVPTAMPQPENVITGKCYNQQMSKLPNFTAKCHSL